MWFFKKRDEIIGKKLKISRLTIEENPKLVREMYDNKIQKLASKQDSLLNVMKASRTGPKICSFNFKNLETRLKTAIKDCLCCYNDYGDYDQADRHTLTKKGAVVADDIWKVISSNFKEKLKNGKAIMALREEINGFEEERDLVLSNYEDYY